MLIVMSDTTQLIKDRLEVADFLKQYLELKPAGKNYKALCPFHKEKTPSFMVSPERQSWHCFGCSQGGDVIKFLMLYENLEFYDALKILAEKTGVEIKSSGNRDFKARNSLYEILNEAKDFYKNNLWQSRQVLDYVKERGLNEETVKEFELGSAPDGSDILVRHLLKKGYSIRDIDQVGLAFKTERGTYWDRFRARLMFPIHNHFGKTVAFTGRIFPGNENPNVGKYVNSPETPLFQKSKILYGFHKTKNDIRQTGLAVLVEGQMDFLMLWQDGVKNAVATSGTALTQEHLKVLRRLTDELVLSFDADEAGQAATERMIDLAGANDFSVKLLIIPEAGNMKDPADVVKSKPGLTKLLVKDAKSAMEYYFHKYISNLPIDLKLKKQNIRTVLLKIKNLSSHIDQNHWLKELANIVKIDEKILLEEMNSLTAPVQAVGQEKRSPNALVEDLSRRDLIAQRLLGVMLYKNNFGFLENHLPYFPEKYLNICQSFVKSKEGMAGDVGQLMDAISLRFSFENQNIESVKLESEIPMLFKELKIEYLKEKRQVISELIRQLESGGNEPKLKEALREFDIVSKELYSIE